MEYIKFIFNYFCGKEDMIDKNEDIKPNILEQYKLSREQINCNKINIINNTKLNQNINNIIINYLFRKLIFEEELLLTTINIRNILNEFSERFFRTLKIIIFKKDMTWYMGTPYDRGI